VLGSVAVLPAGCRSSPRGDLPAQELSSWGLPADLPARLANVQLETLELPSSVTSLDWLSARVHSLVRRGGALAVARGLPSGLVRLDLCNSMIEGPLSIPETVRSLDLRSTGLPDLPALPPQLLDLAVGDPRLAAPRAWPSALLSLSVEDADWTTLPPLPETLRVLAVRMPGLKELPDLPDQLETLVIADTQVESLHNLPAGLGTLVLLHNVRLHEVAIPKLLGRLVLDGINVDRIPLPVQFLHSLEVSRSRLDSLGSLPPRLTELQLNSVHLQAPKAPAFPLGIRRLSLIQMQAFPALPPDLEFLDVDQLPPVSDLRALRVDGLVLRMPGLDRLDVVPRSVKSLDLIGGARLPDLAGVPMGLSSLTMAGVTIGSLRPLPPGLEHLDLSGSTLAELPDSMEALPLEYLSLTRTNATRLPRLPPSLRYLDVSYTEINDLAGLPDGLETLVLTAGQEGLPALPSKLKNLHLLPLSPERPCDDSLALVYADRP
jgi:Leucine-rich repeat (LRR) protein